MIFIGLPIPADKGDVPEAVIGAIRQLDGPMTDKNNARYEPPLPKDRNQYSACPICGNSFGLFRRKNNCGNCGLVVCSDCLDSKWYLAKYGLKTPISCCSMCNHNLTLSTKTKYCLEQCSVRVLRAFLIVYGLYNPNTMIEKSDLVNAIYENSPIPNENELHYRNSLPTPADSTRSTSRQRQRQRQNNARNRSRERGSNGSSWDRMFVSVGNDIGSGFDRINQGVARAAEFLDEALDSRERTYYTYTPPPTYDSHTYSHTHTRAWMPQSFNPETHYNPPPPPPQRPRSAQDNRPFANSSTGSQARMSERASASQNVNPSASAPAAAQTPKLKDLVHNNTDLSSLSVKTLKQLLVANHVDHSNIVEKHELVQRVKRLVDNTRLEMQQADAAASSPSGEQPSEDNTCKICLDAITNCVFLNCGHMCACLECGNRIISSGRRECPICREYIAKVIHVFRA
ncbi:hypothetical protein LPJ78_002406 [Coemansia sp. RSA 989]|nr:hypothetical protein BX667DRAFT_495143 [Coemansia mojavensis]KAJ1865813.1 hypothetical protein LPJ78_002406 [Coemansia sp. RSA 989]KAJ1875175.1 hypothetical protein LPJ55_000847 [Coemansia sp. RSA 990]KAJ2650573.1 hypothetical protein IWW40_002310 [Coemansia sp. RSA 1250]KAJ2671854.1 hypothetical protein IWW42_003116 [Coemansia sp. RSA 1085]